MLVACSVLALALPAAATAVPAPHQVYEFDDTLRSSLWGDQPFGTAQYAVPHSFEDAVIPGAPRTPVRVVRIPPGGGLTGRPMPSHAGQGSWAVAMLFSLDDVSGPARLVSHDFCSDRGLYVENGRLVFHRSVPAVGATDIRPGEWHQVVLSRDAAGDRVRIHLDGELELEFGDEEGAGVFDPWRAYVVGLFHDHTCARRPHRAEGRIARVRFWREALSAADAAGLDQLDGTPPFVGMRAPEEGAVTGTRPTFYGNALGDDVTPNPHVRVVVRNAAGTTLATGSDYAWWGAVPADWRVPWPASAPDLEHGERYTVVVTAIDGAGNRTSLTRSFVVDARQTGRMTLTELPGAESLETMPRVAGRVATHPADAPFVQVVVGRPYGDAYEGVRVLHLPIVDGAFGGAIADPLAPGDYVLRVSHLDRFHDAVVVERRFRVLAPPLLEVPFAVSAEADGTAIRRAVARTLRRASSRRLLTRGVAIPLTTTQPGVASVQLYARGAGAGAASARRLLARGRLVAARSGRATLRLRPTKSGRHAVRSQPRRALRALVRTAFKARHGRPASATFQVTLRR